MSATLGATAGRYGRLARAVIALWLIAGGVSLLGRYTLRLDTLRPPGSGALADAAQAAGYLVATLAVYTALVWLLGDRLLARLNPWSRAALLLVPVVAATMLAVARLGPTPLLVGELWYVGASLLAVAAVGYSGCEVAGIPMLVLRRRYPVYCALNALDAVEPR